MTTEKAKPLTAEMAKRFVRCVVPDRCAGEALDAIAEGRHVVIEAEELDAIRETIRQQDLLLDGRKAELERLRADARLGALVRKKMTSGNDIPVERCVIKRAEIDAAQQEQEQTNDR